MFKGSANRTAAPSKNLLLALMRAEGVFPLFVAVIGASVLLIVWHLIRGTTLRA